MKNQYKILAEFVKDCSSETENIETYLFVKKNISNYKLNVDIYNKPLKNKIIEINIVLRFEDKNLENKRSHFEINYVVVIKLIDNFDNKKKLKKILLSEIPTKVCPNLVDAFTSLMRSSGFPEVILNHGDKMDCPTFPQITI